MWRHFTLSINKLNTQYWISADTIEKLNSFCFFIYLRHAPSYWSVAMSMICLPEHAVVSLSPGWVDPNVGWLYNQHPASISLSQVVVHWCPQRLLLTNDAVVILLGIHLCQLPKEMEATPSNKRRNLWVVSLAVKLMTSFFHVGQCCLFIQLQ